MMRITLFFLGSLAKAPLVVLRKFYMAIALDAGATKVSTTDYTLAATFPKATNATAAMLVTASKDANVERIKTERI